MTDKNRKKKYMLLSALSLLVFLLIWELVTDVLHIFSNLTLASPIQVVETFFYKLNHTAPDGGTIQAHMWASLKVALSGYALSLIVGIPLGIFMA